MSSHERTDDDEREHFVVVNHEEQYSIWPLGRKVPAGWEVVEGPASKVDCLRRIDELWTDMRPRSVRERLGEQSQ